MRESRAVVVRLTVALWAVAVTFAAITLVRSEQLGIPLRDPDAVLFRRRLTTAVIGVVLLAVADLLVRTWRARDLPGSTLGRLRDTARRTWPASRVFLVASALLAYHVVYVCYRNLKSWDAFNTPRDADLAAFDRWLFGGHTPAVLLHDLLGRGAAAPVLSAIYHSFTYLVPLSVVSTLALIPQVRRAYVMVCTGAWMWILGLASYYLIPSLGPFASSPQDFAGLRPTSITETQAEYLDERAHLLAHPQAHDAFASISAFASLHVGFTCAVLLVAAHYGHRRLATALGVYLAAVVVATIYFGWHFVSDDIAGVVIAFLAVGLARLMVRAPSEHDDPDLQRSAEVPVAT